MSLISQLGRGVESIAPEALGGLDTSSPGVSGAQICGTLPQGAGLVGPPQHNDQGGTASILENSLGSPTQGLAMTAPAVRNSGEGKQLGENLLGGVSKFYGGVSKVTGMVAKLGVPEISQFAALSAVATKAASEGAGLGVAKLEGCAMQQAESQALSTIAQTAKSQIGSILPIPGGGKLLGDLTEKRAAPGEAS